MTEFERPLTVETRMQDIETDPEALRILNEAPLDLPLSTKHALELQRLVRSRGLIATDVYQWMVQKRIERQKGMSDHG